MRLLQSTYVTCPKGGAGCSKIDSHAAEHFAYCTLMPNLGAGYAISESGRREWTNSRLSPFSPWGGVTAPRGTPGAIPVPGSKPPKLLEVNPDRGGARALTMASRWNI